MFGAFWLLVVALVCALFSLVVAWGGTIGHSTWQEWVSGALLAALAYLLIPRTPAPPRP